MSVAVGALSVGALVMAGCSSTPGGSDVDTDSLRVVMLGSENESLDYGSAQSYFPWAVVQNVCDSLVTKTGGPSNLLLAESIEPNEDATEWTITLREEPTFHDGSPVTAEDAMESLRYFAESPGYSRFYNVMDDEGMTVVDERTLTVPLTESRWDFVDTMLSVASVVYQGGNGTSDNPACSGPFELESYSRESGVVLTRFDDYWGERANLERVEIRRVNDPTARVNALVSGEADFAFDIPTGIAETVNDSEGYKLLKSEAADSSAFYFALNERVAPFDDPEVRRAVKLAIDREQLVEVVFGGYGEIGNDLFGKDLPGYLDNEAEWERDLDEAQRIFEEAGVTGLSITVAEGTPGLLSSADLLSQQLADAGVTVTIDEIDPSSWFTDLDALNQSQILAWYAVNQSPLAGQDTWFGAENPYNYSGWNPDEFTELVNKARSHPDENERESATEELQQLHHDQGAYVIWGYRNQLSGVVEGLTGVELNQGTPLFGNASRE